MHKDNHHSPVAIAYARSMLELARESGQMEPIGEEIRALRQIVDAHPLFGQILADPAISTSDREQLLRRVFDGRVSPLVMKFLGLLNEKGRLGLLPSIAGAYDDLVDEQLGKVEVDVTAATQLDAGQLQTVQSAVSTALKKNAVVHNYVDESILGGLILRVQDQLLDGSVRAQLAAMKQLMLAARKN
jgi:F-type H+-transporting ATPase subunit delta